MIFQQYFIYAINLGKGMSTQAVIEGFTSYVGSKSSTWGKLASTLGMLGAGALLASYSRDNEREAEI